jgi:hypothetical protein
MQVHEISSDYYELTTVRLAAAEQIALHRFATASLHGAEQELWQLSNTEATAAVDYQRIFRGKADLSVVAPYPYFLNLITFIRSQTLKNQQSPEFTRGLPDTITTPALEIVEPMITVLTTDGLDPRYAPDTILEIMGMNLGLERTTAMKVLPVDAGAIMEIFEDATDPEREANYRFVG